MWVLSWSQISIFPTVQQEYGNVAMVTELNHSCSLCLQNLQMVSVDASCCCGSGLRMIDEWVVVQTQVGGGFHVDHQPASWSSPQPIRRRIILFRPRLASLWSCCWKSLQGFTDLSAGLKPPAEAQQIHVCHIWNIWANRCFQTNISHLRWWS